MSRFHRLGIAVALSLVLTTASFGQPVPAPAIPATQPPTGVVPSDPKPAEATSTLAMILKGEPLVPAMGDDELRRLLIARYNAALGALNSASDGYRMGIVKDGNMFQSGRYYFQTCLDLCDHPADQIEILKQSLESEKHHEAKVKSLYNAQTVGGEADRMHQATYLRLDAEIRLLRAQRKAGLTK